MERYDGEREAHAALAQLRERRGRNREQSETETAHDCMHPARRHGALEQKRLARTASTA